MKTNSKFEEIGRLDHGKHRPKDLFGRDTGLGRNPVEDHRTCEVTARLPRIHFTDQLGFCLAQLDVGADLVEGSAIDERPDRGGRVRRCPDPEAARGIDETPHELLMPPLAARSPAEQAEHFWPAYPKADASVTLVPAAEHLMPIDLVREEFDFDALMAMAIRFRPDLEQVRVLVEEIAARTDASRWGELGPFFGLAYQIGAIGADEGEGLSSLEGQQRFSAGVGADWSFAAFANLEAAQAFEQQVILEADRKLDEVKAEVASALADATLYRALLSQSKARLSAAEEAARLVQSSFSTGTVTLLDVLQAQEALSRARLEHAEIVVHYNTTQVELLAALGMIDGDRLALTSVISDQ